MIGLTAAGTPIELSDSVQHKKGCVFTAFVGRDGVHSRRNEAANHNHTLSAS